MRYFKGDLIGERELGFIGMSGCITLGGSTDSTLVLIVLRGHISFFIDLPSHLFTKYNVPLFILWLLFQIPLCCIFFFSSVIQKCSFQTMPYSSFFFSSYCLSKFSFFPFAVPSFIFSSYRHSQFFFLFFLKCYSKVFFSNYAIFKFSFFFLLAFLVFFSFPYAISRLLMVFPNVKIGLFFLLSFDISRLLFPLAIIIPRLLFLLPIRNLRFLFLLLLPYPGFSSFFFSIIPSFSSSFLVLIILQVSSLLSYCHSRFLFLHLNAIPGFLLILRFATP